MKSMTKLICLATLSAFSMTGCISQQQITLQGAQANAGGTPSAINLTAASAQSGPVSRHVVVLAART